MCMNLRSRRPTDLIPRVDNIRELERELTRKRREERQVHLNRLDFEMERNPGYREDGRVPICDDNERQGEGAANLQPQHPNRQARPIGTYDQPNIHGNIAGIRAPAVENNNFEIKSSLINMIQSNKYHELALEDPFDHLDNLGEILNLYSFFIL